MHALVSYFTDYDMSRLNVLKVLRAGVNGFRGGVMYILLARDNEAFHRDFTISYSFPFVCDQ